MSDREVKQLIINLVCPPGQFAIKTSWDETRINHAITHPDDDGFHELRGTDETNDTVVVRWKENSTLFYTIMEYKKPSQIAVPRPVLDRKVQ